MHPADKLYKSAHGDYFSRTPYLYPPNSYYRMKLARLLKLLLGEL